MILIIGVGLFLVYWFGFKDNQEDGLIDTMLYCMLTILALFAFMVFISVPLQGKLLKMVILKSLEGIVSDVTFNSKKGYSKESFEKLDLVSTPFMKFGNVDYYSFKYNDQLIESTTVKAYDEYKIPKEKGKKGSKSGKTTVVHFFGRIYIIPFESGCSFNVFGKKFASTSRKKEMASKEYCNEYPLKFKKYFENFEVYYKDKPEIDMADFIDKLLTLKIQSKGAVSAFVRPSTLVLCLDNNRHYAEIEVKNPINENLIREYKRDVNIVLNFINSLNKEEKK